MDLPTYQSSTLDKIRFALQRAFVPKLTDFKIFLINELVQDVILIEGLAVDFNTRDIFTGPCYIPKSTTKLMLSKSSMLTTQLEVETRLLIIVNGSVDNCRLKTQGEKCELVKYYRD